MRAIISGALLCLCFITRIMAQTNAASLPSHPGPGYIVNDSVLIKTRDGAYISALMVRKAAMQKPQATILYFTIYARPTDIKKAIEAADRGYAGIVAYTRGKRYSPETRVAPYEYDGRDAYDVIDWIAHQSWSNQQVGMYGGSYSGFAQWAATKQLHPALKTIVPSAAVAPGLDAPMTNNVIMTFPFSWTYYVSNNKWLDEDDYRSRKWNDVQWQWFREGGTYRSLDTLAGRPGNRIFHSWIDHPTYDRYWQNMIPYRNEFAHINIPVLTTTGYYDGGQIGATYYLREHLRYNPKATHYLLIGPYGHFGCQGYPDSVFNGYRIDPAANVPIHEIIYQWFDHILKGGPKPAILQDNINYQVMGSNQWKHVPTLSAMSNDSLTLYLQPAKAGNEHELAARRPSQPDYLTQLIDFADRTTFNSYYYINNLLYDSLPINNGIVYKSAPLQTSFEITGRFSGQLSAMINKKDMDFSVVLFEQMSDGRYFYLTYFMGRASYAYGGTSRRLLKPGRKSPLPFTNTYITSRLLHPGSRIVAIVNINKSPFEQINYGTGREVSLESIRDAKEPLEIRWYNDSYLKIPISRQALPAKGRG
ncbi:CocE/NonD family hydrolase [Paraflavitalea sp. CAU 1676]|uniref:CocE/NonD family hydrolase n=1 Tax=Paraflavitalea sp. CAU 1676 TaxID=3032598 RepID=UPI0023DC2FED|nr:CocE/NonD family hydrolase [Paraflavitalea sp. CAU 1676]MDF2189125.1 CocE/NonD family hydrolase [Paraflavitalea sp. CAU 1676]